MCLGNVERVLRTLPTTSYILHFSKHRCFAKSMLSNWLLRNVLLEAFVPFLHRIPSHWQHAAASHRMRLLPEPDIMIFSPEGVKSDIQRHRNRT